MYLLLMKLMGLIHRMYLTLFLFCYASFPTGCDSLKSRKTLDEVRFFQLSIAVEI
jgi:hypothetical protein